MGLPDRVIGASGGLDDTDRRLSRAKQRHRARARISDDIVVKTIAEASMPDRQDDVADLDARIQIERGLDLEQHRTGVESIGIADASQPTTLPKRGEIDLAGMTEAQLIAILRGIYLIDRPIDNPPEAPSAIGEFHIIIAQHQVIGVPLVVEADAANDGAAFQFIFELHQRVAISADIAFFCGGLEAGVADPPKDERASAHRLHEAKNFAGFARKAAPQLRPRQEFEDFGVVVAPEPDIATDRVRGFG